MQEDVRPVVAHDCTPTHYVGVTESEEAQACLKENRKADQQCGLYYDGRKRVWENDSKNEIRVAGTARSSGSDVLKFSNLQELRPRNTGDTGPTDDADGKGCLLYTSDAADDLL